MLIYDACCFGTAPPHGSPTTMSKVNAFSCLPETKVRAELVAGASACVKTVE
jgi:hypothetical protein